MGLPEYFPKTNYSIMKKIVRIAQVELSILFYSPIAWLVLIIFIVQCGMTITDLLDAPETSQQLWNELKALTEAVFGGRRGFFSSVQNKLYLYIPLLTMGLMSRELNSGSIKLLFSSPVTNQQIILGKFLAMAAYSFLLVLVLLGVMLIGIVSIEAMDIQFVLGGILGLYILACAYSAIGLFMSSLTPYQVVAAISTLAVFAALDFVGTVGQSIDFVRDITYWVSIADRADNFMSGLISSKDLIYFILIICLFLTLSIMRLNSGRKTRSRPKAVLRYGTLVVTVLLIGYLSSLPLLTAYHDTTRFKTRTLTKNSQSLLQQLEEPITITSYTNIVNYHARFGSPKWRIFDLKQFDQYIRFLPKLEMDYVPYYDYTLNSQDDKGNTLLDRAQRAAIALGYDFDEVLSPDELKKTIDLTPEENLLVRIVQYNGKKTSLRMFLDMLVYPGEAEISAAIKRLLTAAPRIGVLTDNNERSINKTGDKGYKATLNTLTSRGSLINQGFEVMNIPIDETIEIPLDLSVLLIADPIGAYTPEQTLKIQNYIADGGNIIIAGEPGKQHVFNPIIESIGLTFSAGTLLQESKDFRLDLLQAHISGKASLLGFSQVKKDVISMPKAMQVLHKDTLGFKMTPILVTDKQAVWNKLGVFNLETDEVVFDPEVDNKIEATTALALTRGLGNKQQKVMVLGDADFMSNAELARHNITNRNFQFTTDMFKWFSNGEFPIDTKRPDPIDNKIIVSREQISMTRIILIGVVPLLLGILGAYILIKRKRK